MGARDTLLGAAVPSEDVTVGGEVVEVRGLTIARASVTQKARDESVVAAMLRDACYLNGEPLFGPDDDIDGLSPTGEIRELIDAMNRVMGNTPEDVEGN